MRARMLGWGYSSDGSAINAQRGSGVKRQSGAARKNVPARRLHDKCGAILSVNRINTPAVFVFLGLIDPRALGQVPFTIPVLIALQAGKHLVGFTAMFFGARALHPILDVVERR